MNSVVLVGRLGRDPEMRYVGTEGNLVVNFSLAVDEPPRKGEKRPPTWLNVVAWNKLGEVVSEYLHKGDQIALQGRLQSRKWEAQDGTKRSAVEVVAEKVQFLKTQRREEGVAEPEPEPAADAAADSDVPF